MHDEVSLKFNYPPYTYSSYTLQMDTDIGLVIIIINMAAALIARVIIYYS